MALNWDVTLHVASGLTLNVQITLVALLISLLLSVIFVAIDILKIPVLWQLVRFYVSVFRGTPLLLQLFMLYYILLAKDNIPIFYVACLGFGLNSAAYISEILRGAINSIDKGQWEAARSLGLNFQQTMSFIIFPQALRNALPALINEVIDLLKETSLVAVIGGVDILKRAQIIAASSYDYSVYIVVGIVYYLITSLIARIINITELKLKRC